MATPGLSNANIRLVESDYEPIHTEDGEVIIEEAEEGDQPNIDEKGRILSIEHPDGSISISLGGAALNEEGEVAPNGWFSNLAEEMEPAQLSSIAEDLLVGISDDETSRKEWVEDRATGIKLLGLKLEIPNQGGASEGAPVEGMSMVRHPLLLEAVLRFQANARSEFLPTDGPTKIRDDSNNPTLEQDELAQALQKDLNHYLTVTASEYYDDTDRMFLLLGFGGTTFKKVFFCPDRNRPVSETVDADDLIVNNSAVNLENARRITHRIYMRPSQLRRMQLLGVYRDVDLPDATMQTRDAVQQEKDSQQGISRSGLRSNEIDREIYECYCELDIAGYEHEHKGKPSGLPVPYRVTIDKSSREVLSIVRNYDKKTEELPRARQVFVKYTYVPGFGFYDIGLLNILGNTTNAVTAGWREMLDAGMFANFPGFLYSDAGGRQTTNIFRVPPGGAAQIKTGGMPINQVVSPLPYKEPGTAMMNMIKDMAETGQRVGGTAEIAVGEGKQDAPVGTTLALLDQATKVLNSIHKRLHTAQARELQLIAQCFREHPDSFWKFNDKPALSWDQKTFEDALENYDLVPQADPNTSSQAQRLMKIMGLMQLKASDPMLYDNVAVNKAALTAMGWSNPDQFLKPEAQRNQPPPEMMKEIKKIEQDDAKIAIDKQRVAIDAKKVDGDLALGQAKLQIDAQPEAPEQQDPTKLIDAETKARMATVKEQELEIKAADVQLDAQNRAADRESRERMGMAKIIQDGIEHPDGLAAVKPLLTPDYVEKMKENG